MVKKLNSKWRMYYGRQIMACLLAYLMLLGIPISTVLATPTGADVVAGNAAVNQAGNTTTVNMNSSQAVINWNSLNTSQSEILQFLKAGGSFAVLNRVVQGGTTQFNGSLFGNQGHIIIVNPHGIVFGPTALVNAYKFTASALDISEPDFMNGIYNFSGDGVGKVANYGNITAEQVALIGKKVLNAGTIKSPGGYTIMAAGDQVYLGNKDSDVIVEVAGVTVSDPTEAGLKTGDVINEGTIEAAGGQIVLAAGDTFSRAVEGLDELSVAAEDGIGRVGQFGTLNADGDGGKITLTAGETVALGEQSVTTANAGENGDGGEIIAYSPGTTIFREGAQVEAKGGSESGNGGFFELSGKEYVEANGRIDLTAQNGSKGLFLLDPRNIKIVDDIPDEGSMPGNVWEPDNWWGQGDSAFSKLGIDKLNEYLVMGDVTLETDYWSLFQFFGGGQNGWVIFDATSDVHTDPGNTSNFTVNAEDYILLNALCGIDFGGSGNVTLNAKKDITINAGINTGGDITLYADRNGNTKGNMYSDPGATITAGGNVTIRGNKVELGDAVKAGVDEFGQVTLPKDLVIVGRDCCGGNDDIDWFDVYAHSTLEAGGDIEISVTGHEKEWHCCSGWKHYYYPGTITLDDDVTAGGNLSLYNDTYTTDVTGNGVTLQAGQDVFLKNSLDPYENCTKLQGLHKLAIVAGAGAGVTDGTIHAENTEISVTGSTLSIEQDPSINLSSLTFSNQADTDLTLVSNEGSVTADSGDNAADKWNMIGATAKDDITLAGDGSIKLGDSGQDTTKSLWAKEGDIDVSAGYNVDATKDLTAGRDIKVHAKHGITLQAADSGLDMDLHADTDTRWGHDMVASGHLDAGGTMELEGTNVDIQSARSDGDMTIYAHGLYDGHPDGSEPLIGSGDVTAAGELHSGGTIEITATAFGHGGAVTGPDFQGNNTAYESDGTIYLKDNATADVDIILHNNTELNGYNEEDGYKNQAIEAGYGEGHNGTLTAHGWVWKTTPGDLYLYGNNPGDIAITLNNNRESECPLLACLPAVTTCLGNIEIEAPAGDIQISGDLTTFGVGCDVSLCNWYDRPTGGVSIIAEDGKIYTEGASCENDTLNIGIVGNSSQLDGLGVGLPYDESKKAAIVVMSSENLNFGPDTMLIAKGSYMPDVGTVQEFFSSYGDFEDFFDGFANWQELIAAFGGDIELLDSALWDYGVDLEGIFETEGNYMNFLNTVEQIFEGIDDRAAINFLDTAGVAIPVDGPVRDEGEAIDVAVYLASTGKDTTGEKGNVYLDGRAIDVEENGTVVVDAYDTVRFGEFETFDLSEFESCEDLACMLIKLALRFGADIMDNFTFDDFESAAEVYFSDLGYASPEDVFDEDPETIKLVVGDFLTEFFGEGYFINIDRLEVCSRITEWLVQAIDNETLPYADSRGIVEELIGGDYILRGAGAGNPEIGDGAPAWVLETPIPPIDEKPLLGTDWRTMGPDGCPVLLAAAAEELGIAKEDIQVSLSNAMVMSTDIQPCDTCARLVNASTILKDPDGSRMAAMNQVFNELAPADAPFTPEMAGSIVTVFSEHLGDGTQYATVIEYLDAFVEYVAVLDSELGAPVADGDSFAFVLGKYGDGITGNDNPNMAAFLTIRLEAGDTLGG